MRRAVDPSLALKLAAIVGAMFAFGFALVPLYDAFCSLTGFGGKTAGVASAAQLDVKPDKSRIVRVELVASLPRGAPLPAATPLPPLAWAAPAGLPPPAAALSGLPPLAFFSSSAMVTS